MMTTHIHPTQSLLSKRAQYWLLFLGILALYALFIVPNLNRLGIGWDEEIDLRIAQAYLTPRGLFFGLPLDLSQTRLPTFSVALVFRLLGASNLLIARWTSVMVGGLTLLGTYLYGKDRFGRKVGLLAVGLLALNPFLLSFARLAFTESDIYLACTLTWLLVAMSRLQEKPTVGRAAIAGLVLGLSISAKATVLVILPALWIAMYLSQVAIPKSQAMRNISPTKSEPARLVLFWVGWTIFILLVGVYSGRLLELGAYSGLFRLLHYGLVCLGWLLPLVWVFRLRNHTAHPVSLAAFVTGLGLLTFVIFPPDHLTNSGILRSLFSRAENEMSLNAAFVGELAALHVLTLFFKSTPALGFVLLGGTITSLFQWRRQELLLPLLIAASYFAGLLILPLGQTFYTIPILPVISLLAADQFMRLWSRRRQVALLLACVAIGWWGVEMIQCYPDFHLNGYQWLGKRALFGRSSIGYRSVVFTPADGVQQVVEWLNANAEPGQVAQLYIGPWHLVRHFAPEPAYQLTNGFETSLLAKPDYVVLHINDLLWQGHGNDTPAGEVVRYPFDVEALKREYEQVFVVRRAFDLEMASIWQRK